MNDIYDGLGYLGILSDGHEYWLDPDGETMWVADPIGLRKVRENQGLSELSTPRSQG